MTSKGMRRKTMNDFFWKRKMVKKGESETFRQWNRQGVTLNEFLAALEWICEDACLVGDIKRETREACLLTNGRIALLNRQYRKDGSFAGVFDSKGNKVGRQYIVDTLTCTDAV